MILAHFLISVVTHTESQIQNRKHHLVFELVGVFVLLLVQVNEVVCDALLAARLHVPADLEGVTGDVADLDVLRDRELLHLRDAAVLGFTSCVVEKRNTKQ